MVTARSQKQGKTGWLFGLCVVMAILVLIAGCEKKAPKRQSAPLTAPLSVSAAATTPPPATAALAITEAATPAAALPTTSPDGTPVEELLDKTWLGTPERTGEVIDGGLFDGGITCYWYSTNGLHDVLFSATVRDGKSSTLRSGTQAGTIGKATGACPIGIRQAKWSRPPLPRMSPPMTMTRRMTTRTPRRITFAGSGAMTLMTPPISTGKTLPVRVRIPPPQLITGDKK